MAIVLLVAGSLIATVQILRPERLTPLVETAANKMLNADVSVTRVELALKGHYPFLNVTVENLAVTSRDIKDLPSDRRDCLPLWADTLVSIGRFSGGINLPQAMLSKIRLSDVTIDALSVNIVTADSAVNNYNIASPSQPAATEAAPMQIPDFSISSFAITNPRVIRYASFPDSLYAEVLLTDASIADISTDTLHLPVYNLSVHTNLTSPLLRQVQGQSIELGCNGTVAWNHEQPFAVTLSDFDFALSEFSGRIDTSLDFAGAPVVQSLDMQLRPLSVSSVIDLLSDEAMRTYNVPAGLRTDMQVGLRAQLLDEYNLDTDSMPHMQLDIDVPDSYVRCRQLDLRHLDLSASVLIPNDDIDSITVDIKRLTIAGPATSLTVKGTASRLISDPTFDGSIAGDMNLNNLPPVLTGHLSGAALSGHLTMNTTVRAAMSMFDPNRFHRLRMHGTIDGRNIRYAAPDTSTVILISKMHAKFGTHEGATSRQSRQGTDKLRVDSLLAASISIDSARILDQGISVVAGNFKIGIGARNGKHDKDTTAVIPMGGALSFDHLTMTVLQDSTRLNLRRLKGLLTLKRYQGDAHLPQFDLKADIGQIGAGTPTLRFMARQARLDTRLYKLRVARPDSARRRPRRHIESATATDTAEIETVDFGTTREMRRFMRNWRIDGSLSAHRAGLFTAAFPLRNRIDSLHVTFTNDSVVLDRTKYKGGNSDFAISGSVTNIRRAIGSVRQRQPLHIQFTLESDTIDINQLANAFFTGAANTDTRLAPDIEEHSLDADIELVNANDSVAPLLIPVNIDARLNMHARNVLYSDFLLHDFSGQLLTHDGALSLRNLQAASNVGSIKLSALYAAPRPSDMKFGMALDLDRFNIRNFLNLIPAIDSIMPMMGTLGGIVSAKIVATSDVDQQMNLVLPTLNAAINIDGDSLVFLDPATFKTISKWLMFKDKNKNMINHASVEMVIKDNMMQMFPFIFDFDRYRLGVQGTNDLDMNFNYHVAVLKSPLPFKFGINVKGNSEDFKVRIGKARFNEKQSLDHTLVDTTRVNLIRQFENVFRRGIRNSRFVEIKVDKAASLPIDFDAKGDTISAADSLYMKQNGLFNE